MAKFVCVADNDPLLDFVSAINCIVDPQTVIDPTSFDEEDIENAKKSELGKLVKSGQIAELLEKGFFGQAEKILAASEGEINSAVSLGFYILLNSDLEESVVADFTIRFVDLLTSNPENHTVLKLQLLSVIFNASASTSASTFSIYLKIVKFSLASKHTALLKGQLDQLPTWIEMWQLGPEDTASLYILAYQVCKANDDRKGAGRFLFKYLRQLDDAKAEVVEAAKEHAHTAIIEAVSDIDDVSHCDVLLNLAVVKQLKGDSKYGKVFELLHIFASETVGPFEDFCKTYPNYLKEIGLDEDDLRQKLRILTLCSLGVEHEVLEYSLLMDKLQLSDPTALEEAVISAVVSGGVDAKIDQETETVIIKRTTARFFHPDEATWGKLADKLDRWRGNVRNVLKSLHEANRVAVAAVPGNYAD